MDNIDESELLETFDVRKLNSGAISIRTPDQLANQLRSFLPPSNVPTKESEASEDLRLRLITNGLVAARLRNTTPPWLADLDELLLAAGKFAPLRVIEIEQTSFLKVQDWMFVMAPSVSDEAGVVQFLKALNVSESENRSACYWIFDFSAVTYVNHALIAFLIGFQQNLLCRTPAVSLLWLRPEVIPPSLLSTVSRRFNLFKKGSFLLSEGNESLSPF